MASDLRSVSFKNGSIDVVGDLHLPDGFHEQEKYAALVIATPGSSVKEQIGAVYGTRMAAKGFVTLAFDPSYQGKSGGEPRDLEDPAARVEDIRCAVDFLTTLSYVDEERIGMLGICAGGGYAVNAALTEHRIKAVGTVVAVNMGRAFRRADTSSPGAIVKVLERAGKQRTIEARGGEEHRDPWIPDSVEQAKAAGITDVDVLEAVEFYRTRAYNKYSTNRRLSRSNALLLGFDAFHLAGELLTQPLQIIVGGRLGSTGSFEDGKQLWELANNKKDFLVIEGAGHYELYDTPGYVDQAIERLVRFYKQFLDGEPETA